MKHTFRLNVYRKGYTLFSGKSSLQYQEFPLDVVSSEISQNYLSAQRRIDNMLKTKVSRWHFSIANLNSHYPPVVAYGCNLSVNDDKGRSGVNFVHALEGDEPLGIDGIVVGITQLLTHQTIEELTKLLTNLAQGSKTPEEVIEYLIRHFSEKYIPSSDLQRTKNNPIKKIQHDCGGASAMAWLAMTISHLGDSSPWEIYEEYSQHTGELSTVSSCVNASEVYFLSDYLYQLISDHALLENIQMLRTKPTRDRSLGSERKSPPRYPSHSKPYNQPNVLPEANFQENMQHPETYQPSNQETSPQKWARPTSYPKRQRTHYPHDAHVVEMDSLYGDELSLRGESDQFRISKSNFISLIDRSSHYEFEIVLTRLWFIKNQIKLILPKDGLTKRQLNQIEDFYARIHSTDFS